MTGKYTRAGTATARWQRGGASSSMALTATGYSPDATSAPAVYNRQIIPAFIPATSHATIASSTTALSPGNGLCCRSASVTAIRYTSKTRSSSTTGVSEYYGKSYGLIVYFCIVISQKSLFDKSSLLFGIVYIGGRAFL